MSFFNEVTALVSTVFVLFFSDIPTYFYQAVQSSRLFKFKGDCYMIVKAQVINIPENIGHRFFHSISLQCFIKWTHRRRSNASRPSFCPVANCSIFLMVHNGEGQSSHVLVFCVNLEQHICTHIAQIYSVIFIL